MYLGWEPNVFQWLSPGGGTDIVNNWLAMHDELVRKIGVERKRV